MLYSKTTNQIEPSTIFSTNSSTNLRTYRTLPLESTACTSPERATFDSPSVHPWGLSSKTMQNLILEISVTYLIQNIQGISRKCVLRLLSLCPRYTGCCQRSAFASSILGQTCSSCATRMLEVCHTYAAHV